MAWVGPRTAPCKPRSARQAVATASVATIAWPAEVSGYTCRPVYADMPGIGELAALVVDDDSPEGGQDSALAAAGAEEQEDEIPDWVPRSWLSPVLADDDVADIYGAIGVWPAAFVAADLLRQWTLLRPAGAASGRPRMVEIGCGAGFPSLVGVRLGLEVLAVDTEALPLSLLVAAVVAQQGAGALPRGSTGMLETFHGDASVAPLRGADVILVSDLFYSEEIGHAVGTRLGEAAKAGQHLIVIDGGRSGRAAFLKAFESALGRPGRFEDTPIPSWVPQRVDLFDHEERSSIGVLHF